MDDARADVLLARQTGWGRGYCKEIIEKGLARADGKPVQKASALLVPDTVITILAPEKKYVSRGGLKLEKALVEFAIVLRDKICLDVGASTGGFTDCMLQNGARKVIAVDTGTAQLAQSLRADKRVVSMEQTNIKAVTEAALGGPVDFAAIDVSFVSLTKVLKEAAALVTPGGALVCLVKPQFEAGPRMVSKRGLVKNKDVQMAVIAKVSAYAREIGLYPRGVTASPIRGGEGNAEFLLALDKTGPALDEGLFRLQAREAIKGL